MRKIVFVTWLLGIGAMPMISVVVAQTSTPPAAQAAPQRTTSSYDDWILRCMAITSPTPQKVCEVTQASTAQGKNAPFSLIMVPRPASGEPIKMIVTVPVSVTFATPMRLTIGDTDQATSVPLTRCIPLGCTGEFVFDEAGFKKILSVSGYGKVAYADAAGREVDIPVSFKGFSKAYEALLQQ